MQAVILAAGKGTRMGNLTLEIPKPMLMVNGKTLLEHKFDVLPEAVDEIILTIGYLGEKIKNYFGDEYKGKKITYIVDEDLKGTAWDLWKTRLHLKDTFMVLMGDDLYSEEDMKKMAQQNWAILCKRAQLGDRGDRILTDTQGKLTGFMKGEKYVKEFGEGGLMFTGLYTLQKEIFDYPLVKLKTKDEWGLPQTLLGAVPNIDLKIVETDYWTQITSESDLQKAESGT